MPEHVHMLVNEPGVGRLAQVMQSLKQSVSRALAPRAPEPFGQTRHYDFNVWSEQKIQDWRDGGIPGLENRETWDARTNY